jgi:hypothetical protein
MGAESLDHAESRCARNRRGHPRWVRIVVGSYLVVAGLLFAAGQVGVDVYQGATYKCLVDGPSSPEANNSGMGNEVVGSASLWPLGRACERPRADGTGTVTTYSGSWPLTLSTLGLTVGGLALAVSPTRQRGQPTLPSH